jgi:hypothetical protein
MAGHGDLLELPIPFVPFNSSVLAGMFRLGGVMRK